MRLVTWKTAVEIGEDHESLRLNTLLFDEVKARTEAGSASANWIERDGLALFEDIRAVNAGVEIEHMHALGPPLLDDGGHLGLEKAKLAAIDRA